MVVATSVTTPRLPSPTTAITVQQVETSQDFDKTVIEPLREAQAKQAAETAAKAEEAARQAEKARQEAERAAEAATAARVQPMSSYGNNYTPGNCTWYVASRISVPSSMGNANNWDSGLLAAGWHQGPPRRGAIFQTDLGWAGHVGIVEAVIGNMVQVSDMNYAGLGIVTTRFMPIASANYFYQ